MKITRYTLVQRAGLWLDYWTAQLWDKLVKKFPGLQLTQGVNSGAKASAGTHVGLGVLDFYLGKWFAQRAKVVRYAFDIGFFGWYRPELWQRGVRVWKAHVHLGVRGCIFAAQSLKNQFVSWLRGRNGLQGDGKDPFTYRPKNASKAAPYKAPLLAKPKPERKVYPMVNVSFLNTAGNNSVLSHTFKKRLPSMGRASAAGSPGIAGFCEVRSAQEPLLTREMVKRGYLKFGYSHGLALYRRPAAVTDEGVSFDRFDAQDGGTVEGLLRFKFSVGPTELQGGMLHLDHDSSWAKKKSNLKEAVASLERFGQVRLEDQWRERSILFGDFNLPPEKVGSVLIPLGFKLIYANGIDQVWVGKKRATRGGSASSTKSDHKRILAKLGKY